MKAVPIDARPSFPLMKQTDIVSFFHMQMPRWLFTHEKYRTLSLESKVAYTFLLNRFQLSRLNGWVNDQNEVFVIFTREELADEMQVGYKKAIACFKELVSASLIWEKRVGRGNANQIYLACVELPEKDAYAHSAAPFGNGGARPVKTAGLNKSTQCMEPVENTAPELPDQPIQTCQTGSSRPVQTAYPELPNLHPSKKENSKIYRNQNEKVCPSVLEHTDFDAEEAAVLSELFDRSELYVLPEDAREVFQSAIERLYYIEHLKIGGAVLPREVVRSHLWELNGMAVQDAYQKLRMNTQRHIKNSSAYVMTTLYNCICECKSDLLVDPFLNRISAPLMGGEQRC